MAYQVWDSVNNFGTGGSATAIPFRACCLAFHDKLVQTGFVWSTKARSAQVDLVSCGAPAVAMGSNNSGSLEHFRIYELADSLQAAYPIYIKIYFNGVTNYGCQPYFTLQVGTTCDDTTGVLGGLVTGLVYPCPGGFNYGNTSGRTNSAKSCAGIGEGFCWVSYNRSNIVLGASIPRPSLFFILERITDANGNPIAGGFHLVAPTGNDVTANTPLQHRTMTATYDSGWGTKNCRIVAGYTAIASNGAVQFQRMFMFSPHPRPLRSVLLCHSSQVAAEQLTELELVSGQAPVNFLAMGTGQGPCGSVADPNFALMQLCLRT